MTSPAVIWTQALQDAAIALSKATWPHDPGSIPERAREMVLPVGRALTPMQLDCVAMLRSRMHQRTPEENAFNDAWRDAWEAAKPDPLMGSFDPALKPRP